MSQINNSPAYFNTYTPVDLDIEKDTVKNKGDVYDLLVNESSPLPDAKVLNSSQQVHMEGPNGSIGHSDGSNGGSVLEVLEEVIRVGQAMGYSMEGCEKDVEAIIAIQETKMDKISHMDVKLMWGNSNYDFVYSESLGRWNGEAILMGDFNEVRSRDERRGSWFSPSGARNFNHFISSSGLVDVKLEGYSFTWSHPSVYVLIVIYRITDLSFFVRSFSHSDMNGMIRFKKKLQDLKISIRQWIKDKRLRLHSFKQAIHDELTEIDKELDRGMVADTSLIRRQNFKRQLQDIKMKETADVFQKSKVKWAIEGDENSSFFHGIINKKRSQLAIRGIFVDGSWQNDPHIVKEAFLNHFAARFKKPTSSGPKINFLFPNRLAQDQAKDLERSISRDEIRVAVWNCGDNKSPGPDGYTFEFFKKYWGLIGPDFCEAVEHFFVNGAFSKGCNSSFIALIPKVIDAKLVTDFCPISLIGCVYKVVTKIMANRLATVISDIVSNTQSAFVYERWPFYY
nr:hypothetical protein [Tanacetum cinerariifolium]